MRHWDATGKWRAMQQQQQEYALCATVEGSSSWRARAVTGSIPITSTNLTNARALGASNTVFAT